jgi:hypothetical protein
VEQSDDEDPGLGIIGQVSSIPGDLDVAWRDGVIHDLGGKAVGLPALQQDALFVRKESGESVRLGAGIGLQDHLSPGVPKLYFDPGVGGIANAAGKMVPDAGVANHDIDDDFARSRIPGDDIDACHPL